jgi:mono/diheme cytochrome c family protein
MNRFIAALMALVPVAACQRPADPAAEVGAKPQMTAAFDGLYGPNCAGCHGADGRTGAALSLNDSVYRAVLDPAAVRRAIAAGTPGTLMPAFARSAGGTLADSQIDVLVEGIRTRWGRPAPSGLAGAPPYAGSAGSPEAGAGAYATFCARCHGTPRSSSARAGEVYDPSYLALVSDQWLRTSTIVGRPERGMPDWRGDVPGRPMTDQEITNVVAWLAGQRVPFAGQPYAPVNDPHEQ